MVRVPPVWVLLLAISCSSPDPPRAVSPRAIATADAAIAADAADSDPASRQLAAWLALFNDAKRDELAAFRDRTFSAELLKTSHGAGDLMQLRDQTGGFDVKRVKDTTPTRASVVVKERSSDQFARAIVEVEPAPPHRIAKLSLLAITTPDGSVQCG